MGYKTGGAKVGDKILVVDAYMARGDYKNGDILTVRNVYSSSGVDVKENDRGLIDCEYTVIVPPAIKVGDKVRLIDKPWEHYLWNRLPREKRIRIISDVGIVNFVNHQVSQGDGQYCHWNGVLIPTALLERVEDKAVEPVFEEYKQYVFDRDLHNKITGVSHRTWPEMAHNHPVSFEPGRDIGWASGFAVKRVWCREVEAKHRYTPEQEQEAREIVYRLMTTNRGGEGFGLVAIDFVRFNRLDNETYAWLYFVDNLILGDESEHMKNITFKGTVIRTATAKCSPSDEFSADIGRMVAICKLLGEPLPEWVQS